MQIYTIIVTYNALPWIDRCLQSLRESSVSSIPIVIDNASKDCTVQHIREHYAETILFPQTHNLGFGQANNIGFRYAIEHNADYVLLLNQDASIHPQALHYLLAQSDGESLLSPIHLNGDGTRIDHNFKMHTICPANNTLIDDWCVGDLKLAYRVGEVCAACWLLPTSILQKVGGFNPLFFHYGEDNNYYQRLVYHKVNTLLIPQAYMYHDRKFYGNIQAYKKDWIYRRLLFIATNINLTSAQRFKNYISILRDCYVCALPQKRYYPLEYTWSILRLCKLTMMIRKSRQIEKQETNAWL